MRLSRSLFSHQFLLTSYFHLFWYCSFYSLNSCAPKFRVTLSIKSLTSLPLHLQLAIRFPFLFSPSSHSFPHPCVSTQQGVIMTCKAAGLAPTLLCLSESFYCRPSLPTHARSRPGGGCLRRRSDCNLKPENALHIWGWEQAKFCCH